MCGLCIAEPFPQDFCRSRAVFEEAVDQRCLARTVASFLCLLVRLDPGREPPKRSAADKKWIDPLPRREQQERRRLGGSYRHVEVDIASPYSRCRPDLKT